MGRSGASNPPKHNTFRVAPARWNHFPLWEKSRPLVFSDGKVGTVAKSLNLSL
jgi:hypothetical protein